MPHTGRLPTDIQQALLLATRCAWPFSTWATRGVRRLARLSTLEAPTDAHHG